MHGTNIKLHKIMFENTALSENEVNPLAPSDPYMGRTAQLTSSRCILNTYSTNIRTKNFKHAT
jgi:hypothetical protein